MTGTFFDTIIICTMTGLVLVMTGAWNSDFSGAAMTTYAFKSGFSPLVGQVYSHNRSVVLCIYNYPWMELLWRKMR